MADAVSAPPSAGVDDGQGHMQSVQRPGSTSIDRDGPPPVRLQCEDALNASVSRDEAGERAKAVMQSSPRMPAVGFFGRYGDRWYADIIGLGHNAVRRQLFDAFVMANALGKLVLDVGDADLARVYAWLGTLDAFVRVVFEIEDRFIYPLVDMHVRNARTNDGHPVYLPELLSDRGRREAKSHVLDLLADARKTRDVATGETVAKVHALRYALDQFGANILDYFGAMEKFAPKLLKKAVKHGEKEKIKTERKMFEFVLLQPHGPMLAALLTQCIESRTRRREFIDRNIKNATQRANFRAHVKSVESTHMQLARTFDRVASAYERKFNVRAFVKHYDEANDGKSTLEMFGDVDINYEPVDDEDEADNAKETKHDSIDAENDTGVHEPRAEPIGDVPVGLEQQATVGLDDDVIEVHATPEDDEEMMRMQMTSLNVVDDREAAVKDIDKTIVVDEEDDDDEFEVEVPVRVSSTSQ